MKTKKKCIQTNIREYFVQLPTNAQFEFYVFHPELLVKQYMD